MLPAKISLSRLLRHSGYSDVATTVSLIINAMLVNGQIIIIINVNNNRLVSYYLKKNLTSNGPYNVQVSVTL